MSEVIEKLNEGDVFRWGYRESGDDGRWGRYHCCSGIAVVHGGILRDTYWQIGPSFSEGRSFRVDDLQKIDLTRLGNMTELERVPEYQADYYDDADIVDLNHSNSPRGNFYLRKGSVRSQAKMLEVAKYKLEQSESAERSAASKSERLREAVARIANGDTGIHIG
jgi:hypothetical protein